MAERPRKYDAVEASFNEWGARHPKTARVLSVVIFVLFFPFPLIGLLLNRYARRRSRP